MDEIETRVMFDRIAQLEAELANVREQRRHEIACVVLTEMIRARYDHSHHTPDVIAKNIGTAKAYAEKLYPEAK